MLLKHKKVVLLSISLLLGLTFSPFGHAIALHIEEQAFQGQAPHKELNFHWHGIGIKVPNPHQLNGLNRRISIVDLGPNLKDLVDDIAPASATATVNGNAPLDFTIGPKGNLRVVIPAQQLKQFGANDVLLKVYDSSNNNIITSKLNGLFF